MNKIYKHDILGIQWSYSYELEKDKKIKISFKAPIALPIYTTTNKSFIRNLNVDKDEGLPIELLEQAITASLKSKYVAKCNDSFKSFMYIVGYNILLTTNENLFKSLKTRIQNDLIPIEDEEIEKYAAVYMQDEDDSEKRNVTEESFLSLKNLIKNQNNNEYKDVYLNCKSEYKKRFEKVYPFDLFRDMLFTTACSYCGISIKQIDQLRKSKQIYSKSGRGFTLEVERIQPNKEYSADNCCMVCYWCNNAKTDEFSVKDFKEIARGIHTAWKNRGKDIVGFKIKDFKEIDFWKNLK